MDANRKKQLLEEYKNRKPEMGVVCLRCIPENISFLGISKDTQFAFHSIVLRLASKSYPNKRLQQLWTQYGEAGFEQSVRKVLEYEDPGQDQRAALEKLREECLAEDATAEKLWK